MVHTRTGRPRLENTRQDWPRRMRIGALAVLGEDEALACGLEVARERADLGETSHHAVQISGATTKVCRAAGQGRDFSRDLRGVEPGDRQQAAARTGEAENQPNAEEDGKEALNRGPNRGCAYIAAKTV